MFIIDAVDATDDGRARPRKANPKGILVHRGGYDLLQDIVLGPDGPSIARAFQLNPEVTVYTNAENPYTYYVGGDLDHPELDGLVWQTLRLGDVGPHARRWSVDYIGVCAIGDFRVRPMPPRQYDALTELLAILCVTYDFDASAVQGHGEKQGGIKAPGKYGACPGDLLSMARLRDDVARSARKIGERLLIDRGGMTR